MRENSVRWLNGLGPVRSEDEELEFASDEQSDVCTSRELLLENEMVGEPELEELDGGGDGVVLSSSCPSSSRYSSSRTSWIVLNRNNPASSSSDSQQAYIEF